MKKHIALLSILFVCMATSFAQRHGGFDPNEMIAREKQNLYKKLPNLTADQKMLLDGIYDEFGQSFGEIREEVRKTRDWQNMRPKMEELRKEKDELIKDVLNEEEFVIYTKLMENNRERRSDRQGGGNKQQKNSPTDSIDNH